MDPDECLRELREQLAVWRETTSMTERIVATEKIAELFEALDDWMSKDGFLPIQWQRFRGSAVRVRLGKPEPAFMQRADS